MESPAFYRAVHRVIHVLTGVVFLGVSALFVFAPVASYAAVGLVFGVAVLFAGILEVLYALVYRRTLAGWGWHLAAGLLDIVAGVYLNAYPAVSMAVIPFLAAFWLIWRGLTLCGYAASLPRSASQRRWVEWTFGIGAIVWGLVMLWWPAEGVFTLVNLLAVAFLWMGIWRIAWGIR